MRHEPWAPNPVGMATKPSNCMYFEACHGSMVQWLALTEPDATGSLLQALDPSNASIHRERAR